ncbi:MAG: OmpA family protein [Deltaproteobacteria bacterium]|nr:OmpA family protein [Deltaproteobacteria bacterium]
MPLDDPPAQGGAEVPLKLEIDKSKVDLKGHKLEARATRELSKIEIKVLGESGAVLAQQEHGFAGTPAGTVLEVTWTPSSEETVARIELIARDLQRNWVGVALIPWSVSIPHQDVNFKTGSADIQDSEKAKLEASYTKVTEILSKHQDLGTITLFIAGHTDTVGRSEDNLRLSLRRAQAISAWFRKRGLTLPIAYEGFGESSLLVKTADNVDEARNRRVDYILSLDEPVFKTTGFKPSWKRLTTAP